MFSVYMGPFISLIGLSWLTNFRYSMKGCGQGYDVVMLALHGFDVYGLDISATGISAAQSYACNEQEKPQHYNFGEKKSCSTAPGSVTFIQGDFFKSDWEQTAREGGKSQFDIIYDYTVSS